MQYLQVNKGAIKNRCEGILNEINFVYKFIEQHYIFCKWHNIKHIESPHSRRFVTFNNVINKNNLSAGPNNSIFVLQVNTLRDFHSNCIAHYNNYPEINKIDLQNHLNSQFAIIKNAVNCTIAMNSVERYNESDSFKDYYLKIKETFCNKLNLKLADINKTQYPVESILSLGFNKLKELPNSKEKYTLIYYWCLIYSQYMGAR